MSVLRSTLVLMSEEASGGVAGNEQSTIESGWSEPPDLVCSWSEYYDPAVHGENPNVTPSAAEAFAIRDAVYRTFGVGAPSTEDQEN